MLSYLKKLGRYEFLKKHKFRQNFKRLLSIEFANMPFYRYAIALTAMLENRYYANTLIVAKARRETDVTWLVKDFTANLDFIDRDFSQFQLDPDLYEEVNFIKDDFLAYKFTKYYDLIIVIYDIMDIYRNLEDFVIQLAKISVSGARIIFFIKYPSEISNPLRSRLLTSTDELLKYLPFELKSKVELKNYESGRLKDIDLVIDCYKQ